MAWRNNETKEKAYQILQNESELIFYDLETTGFSKQNCRIIQVSGLKYKIEDGSLKKVGEVDTYINPGFSIPSKITEITGISDETVKDAPTEREAFYNIIKPFFGNTPLLGGYNSPGFDTPFMKILYERYGDELNPKDEIDVLKMARDITVDLKMEDKKLGTVARHFGVDAGLTFHNALDDVEATKRLFVLFTEMYKEKDAEEAKLASERAGRPKFKPNVFGVTFWAGYRGRGRVYVKTNFGEFFYDIYNKKWDIQKKNLYQLEEFDMEHIRQGAFKIADAASEEELVKYARTH